MSDVYAGRDLRDRLWPTPSEATARSSRAAFGTVAHRSGSRLAKLTHEPDLIMTDGVCMLARHAFRIQSPVPKPVESLVRSKPGFPFRSDLRSCSGPATSTRHHDGEPDRPFRQPQLCVHRRLHAKPKSQLLGMRGAPGNTISPHDELLGRRVTRREGVRPRRSTSFRGSATTVRRKLPAASTQLSRRSPRVISNLGCLRLRDARTKSMRLQVTVHPGGRPSTRYSRNTGFEIVTRRRSRAEETRVPTADELHADPGRRSTPKGVLREREVPEPPNEQSGRVRVPCPPPPSRLRSDRAPGHVTIRSCRRGWAGSPLPKLVAAAVRGRGLRFPGRRDDPAARKSTPRHRSACKELTDRRPFGVNFLMDAPGADVISEAIIARRECAPRAITAPPIRRSSSGRRSRTAGVVCVPDLRCGQATCSQGAAARRGHAIVVQGGEGRWPHGQRRRLPDPRLRPAADAVDVPDRSPPEAFATDAASWLPSPSAPKASRWAHAS